MGIMSEAGLGSVEGEETNRLSSRFLQGATDVEAIVRYYDQPQSVDSMSGVRGWLGLARLRAELVSGLPASPGRIADVGGGSGVHAGWLAERGYRVSLSDLRAEQVRSARERTRPRPLDDYVTADGRNLPWPDGSFDVVLLLGPMYHLFVAEERRQVLVEARRICRPGGSIWAEGLSRLSVMLGALTQKQTDGAELECRKSLYANGASRGPVDVSDWLTASYYHGPGELAGEFEHVGLSVIDQFALEGSSWLSTEPETHRTDPARARTIFDVATSTSRDPAAIAASPHMIVVGRV